MKTEITTQNVLADLFNLAIKAQQAMNTAKTKTASVGSQLLELAQQAANLDKFLDECAELETAHKNSKRKDKTIPRCWTQAKSNIKAAHKLGLDVSNYSSEGSMRKAVNEKRKALKESQAKTQQQAQLDNLDIMLAKIATSFKDTNAAGRDAAAMALEAAILEMMQPAPEVKPQMKAVN